MSSVCESVDSSFPPLVTHTHIHTTPLHTHLHTQYYIKPYVERKRRYDRWVRRRSVQKIQKLLERVRYEKASSKDTYPALTSIFSPAKDGSQK